MQSEFFAAVQQSLTDADFVFTAEPVALNGSGVEAGAFLALEGDMLSVSIVARGLTPGELHIQHIHGLFDEAGNPVDSAAPTIFADTDLDGYVEVLEGVPAYGDILLALEDQSDGINTDPVADATGEVLFSRSYDITDDSLFFSPVTGADYTGDDIFPLPLREIVIHGLEVPEGVGAGTEGSVDGTGGYKVTLPVAAGGIEAASLDDALTLLSTFGGTGIAEGGSAGADDVGGIAIGAAASAQGPDALAIGDEADASGASTTAVGGESDAIGTAATAFGWRAAAEGERAHALGHIAKAQGDFSLSVGEAASAVGDNTTAIANAAAASGIDALAIGDSAAAMGTSTTAVGGESVAEGIAATAFGWRSSAEGERAHALGHLAEATGDFTLAVGEAASATGLRAVAIGDRVSAEAGEVTLGGTWASYTLAGLSGSGGTLFVAADGTLSVADAPVALTGTADAAAGASAPSVVLPAPSAVPAPRAQDDASAPITEGETASAEGVGSIALGRAATADGRDALSIGDEALASGTSTTSVGGESDAVGIAATAFGWRADAGGERAHALGHIATADGDFSLAVGEAATATGENTTAIGNAAAASGVDALAIGDSASAMGTSTTAVGGESVAAGIAATAFGWRSSAEGERAHALGHLAEASGDFTLALGEAAIATGTNAVAIGSNVTAGENEVALGDGDAILRLPGLGADVGTGGWELVGVDAAGRLFVSDLGVADAVTATGLVLSEAAQVPPVADGPATGTAEVSLAGAVLTVSGSFEGLSSPIFDVSPDGIDPEGNPIDGGHVHIGAADENGPVIRSLDVVDMGDGSGTFSGSFTLTDAEIEAAEAGGLYINLHTEANQGGELRVQIPALSGAPESLADAPIAAPEAAMRALFAATEGGGLAEGDGAGASDTGTIALGNGAQAGGVDGLALGDAALADGTSTTAVGGEATASGIAATAFGWRSAAIGERAHALGHIASAVGDFTLAVGEAAEALSDNATAIANAATAAGIDALAIGDTASSQGTSSTAVGGESVAAGIAATAFGWRATAEGERAHALGHLATASGDRSLAIGEAAVATGMRAIAIGSNVTATGDGEVALGNDAHAYVLAGLGASVDGAAEAVAVDADGRLLSVDIVTGGADGGAGADLVFGTSGDDAIATGAGDDKAIASAGDDSIDFGDGTDTIEYALSRDAVQPVIEADGSVTLSTPGGTDSLSNVERIALEDGAFVYDLAGPEADTAYRLYSAAFARTPDEAGLRFWNGVLADTGDADAIADAFIMSAEFGELYGTDPSDEAYVDALYTNIFGRDADPDGQAFWLEELESGRQDRADVLLFFVGGPENLELTAADTEDGFFVV